MGLLGMVVAGGPVGTGALGALRRRVARVAGERRDRWTSLPHWFRGDGEDCGTVVIRMEGQQWLWEVFGRQQEGRLLGQLPDYGIGRQVAAITD